MHLNLTLTGWLPHRLSKSRSNVNESLIQDYSLTQTIMILLRWDERQPRRIFSINRKDQTPMTFGILIVRFFTQRNLSKQRTLLEGNGGLIKDKGEISSETLLSLQLQIFFRGNHVLSLPETLTTTYRLKSIKYEAAKLWNSLKDDMRQIISIDDFKNPLKNFEFSLELLLKVLITFKN